VFVGDCSGGSGIAEWALYTSQSYNTEIRNSYFGNCNQTIDIYSVSEATGDSFSIRSTEFDECAHAPCDHFSASNDGYIDSSNFLGGWHQRGADDQKRHRIRSLFLANILAYIIR
jgi:hypothetical protein